MPCIPSSLHLGIVLKSRSWLSSALCMSIGLWFSSAFCSTHSVWHCPCTYLSQPEHQCVPAHPYNPRISYCSTLKGVNPRLLGSALKAFSVRASSLCYVHSFRLSHYVHVRIVCRAAALYVGFVFSSSRTCMQGARFLGGVQIILLRLLLKLSAT